MKIKAKKCNRPNKTYELIEWGTVLAAPSAPQPCRPYTDKLRCPELWPAESCRHRESEACAASVGAVPESLSSVPADAGRAGIQTPKYETLQNVGVMSLLRPILLDLVPKIQPTAALALGRLANYNDDPAEAVVKGNIIPVFCFNGRIEFCSRYGHILPKEQSMQFIWTLLTPTPSQSPHLNLSMDLKNLNHSQR